MSGKHSAQPAKVESHGVSLKPNLTANEAGYVFRLPNGTLAWLGNYLLQKPQGTAWPSRDDLYREIVRVCAAPLDPRHIGVVERLMRTSDTPALLKQMHEPTHSDPLEERMVDVSVKQ